MSARHDREHVPCTMIGGVKQANATARGTLAGAPGTGPGANVERERECNVTMD